MKTSDARKRIEAAGGHFHYCNRYFDEGPLRPEYSYWMAWGVDCKGHRQGWFGGTRSEALERLVKKIEAAQ